MPIFDQGYQHWSGSLSGHYWRWFTVTRHGFRGGSRNIPTRILVYGSYIPAACLASMLCLWGLLEQKSSLVQPFMSLLAGFFPPDVLTNPKQFRVEVWTLCFHYFLQFELYVAMIVVVVVGPSLISQDLRFNALPLYFSRPLRRADYLLGKLGSIACFLGMVVIVPSLIAYVLGVLFSLDLSIIADTMPVLLASLAFGVVIVLSAGTLMLALSSLSRNSRYVALFWVALWFVSGAVGFVLDGVDREQRRHEVYRRQYQAQTAHQPAAGPLNGEDFRAQMKAQQEARRKAQQEMIDAEMESSRSNWRPLVSYTGNLSRLGRQLLNTDGVWTNLANVWAPPDYRAEFLMERLGPQYPWYWSAGVLAVLFGLSVCILNFRVRSLDRLR